MPGYLADPPDWNEDYTEFVPATTSILHTTQLPTAKIFLDEGLASSIVKVSPWQNPLEWIRLDSDYVNYMVEEVANLTGNEEIVLAKCADQFIAYHVSFDDLNTTCMVSLRLLQRLIVYVFSHLLLCADAQTRR